ncbi:bifunctional 4-hydroxy-2-oxoglutarate aldolase/2-dehydro-3-deoxy-phosphogluconate aldolase [Alishewanella longhuensis]
MGAGTILSKADAQAAKNAGSQFLVSPASTPKLLQAMLDTGLPLAPGVSTPSEIAMALEMGLTELKFFPANLSGGSPMLNALSGIFQQVRFCPTGGISQQNLSGHLALKNAFVVGGSWVSPVKAVADQDRTLITELSRQATTVALLLKQAA